ncbi:hypothetical protein CB1_000340060 [Camelus ferus]|nr:hypothetical protein CB1_000340060 [Camelus ferus]
MLLARKWRQDLVALISLFIRAYSLVDSSQVSTFLISILLIVYGSFRSLNMDFENQDKEKDSNSSSGSFNGNSTNNSIQTIDSTQALFLPIGASVSLLVMFFFFDSVQVVFTICTAALAMGLCVAMIAFVRLPSLKVSCLLLSGLLIYDVFWVFFSAYIFNSNVMVKVATQPADNPLDVLSRKLHLGPNVGRDVPRLSLPGKLVFPSSTGSHFSMLGIGDIVMPGLLLCFVLRYDNYKKQASGDSCGASGPANISGRMQKVSYFHCTLIGYFVGLLTATVASRIHRAAQPALLYLVPFTLLPLLTMAYLKLGIGDRCQTLPEMGPAFQESWDEQAAMTLRLTVCRGLCWRAVSWRSLVGLTGSPCRSLVDRVPCSSGSSYNVRERRLLLATQLKTASRFGEDQKYTPVPPA